MAFKLFFISCLRAFLSTFLDFSQRNLLTSAQMSVLGLPILSSDQMGCLISEVIMAEKIAHCLRHFSGATNNVKAMPSLDCKPPIGAGAATLIRPLHVGDLTMSAAYFVLVIPT